MKKFMIVLASLLLGACQSRHYDYGPLIKHMPRSILVLPPLNQTPEVDASYGWLSIVTRPLAERGYYVFPVGLVDQILRENGRPTPYEMHSVSLSKLKEVFDADAVMYVTITEWGNSYHVLAAVTTVRVHARLVDLDTGTQIWSGEAVAQRNPDHNQGGILGAIIGALVSQVVNSLLDPTLDVARDANGALLFNSYNGLLLGPLHPEHDQQMKARREALK
ncbi:MAG: hypothetical protein ACI8TQ_004086 [Planctomycetota bacterium]|jgi:hypothetical protein